LLSLLKLYLAFNIRTATFIFSMCISERLNAKEFYLLLYSIALRTHLLIIVTGFRRLDKQPRRKCWKKWNRLNERQN